MDADPKVVLQAHALRVRAARDALLRGGRPARTSGTGLGALWVSAVLGIVGVGAVILVVRIMVVLQHRGH